MADKEMKVVFERPHALPRPSSPTIVLRVLPRHRQPSCGRVPRRAGRGRLHRGIAPVGCTVTSYDFYGCV